MDPELFNIYVEKMQNRIAELTKTTLILEAQLSYNEKMAKNLVEENANLQDALDKANVKASNKKEKGESF
jgi:hypothetical protein|tara:strand:- start:484 stop:693 length:210 start_codon:yes stop_codon:yes gene_type:complete